MKLVLPGSIRGEVEAGLPEGLEVSWYDGAPENCEAMADAEVAWINILDGDGQARAIEAGPKLKWVTTIQAGVNTWPLQWMQQRGLLFTNGPGLAAPPMAEFVVMGMLALIKNLKGLIEMQAQQRWAPHSLGGLDLVGAKALIIGYGAIGRAIGRRLQAFEVEVTGVRRHPSGEPGVIGPDDWKPRLGEFDWVILAAASTAETRGMIGENELKAMKPGARIVNVARGFMIDQPAMIAALQGGRLAGALLDVTEPEPPPKDDPIWTAPNALLTGHSSAVGTHFYHRAAALFLDNLDRYRKGEPLRNLVNLELGYWISTPLIPAKAGTQDGRHKWPSQESRRRSLAHIAVSGSDLSWVPAFAGMSGNGVMAPPETTRGELQDFLVRFDLAAAGEPQAWTVLSGGVSSDIWRVDLPGRSLCVKRALPKLRVKDDWEAPPDRNLYEWRWFRTVRRWLPDAAPEPLAFDPERRLLAMAFLPPENHPLWKAEMLAGRVDPGFAAQVGERLGRIHASSAAEPELASQFASDDGFFALRIDAYLLATARRRPEVSAEIEALAGRTAARRTALVHGDATPKNILMGPMGPVFLDAETAWWGDPAFDAASVLNHLLLKRLVVTGRARELNDSFSAMATAWLGQIDFEPRAGIEARAASLLPALLLARVDGKSPVEYITTDAERDLVRRTSIPLLKSPPETLEAVRAAWDRELTR